MKKIIILPASVVFFIFCAIGFAADEARISRVSGTANLRSAEKDVWYAAKNGSKLKTGQVVRTKARSRVKVVLADGSTTEIFPNSQISLSNMSAKEPALKVMFGRIRAWVSKNVSGRTKFEVRTPVAVCSVRGTEFSVEVDEQGKTEIEVYKGLVGVRKSDDTGEEIPVGAGEKLNVTADKPVSAQERTEALSDRAEVRREVGLDMTKEQVQAAAAARNCALRNIAKERRWWTSTERGCALRNTSCGLLPIPSSWSCSTSETAGSIISITRANSTRRCPAT